MAKIYATVREARNALSLDTGFDPFTTGHVHGRCTRETLATLGYVVDAEAAAEDKRRREHKLLTAEQANRLCRPVGRCAQGHLWSIDQHGKDCPACGGPEILSMECDNGHRWSAPYNETADQCPRCGEHAV